MGVRKYEFKLIYPFDFMDVVCPFQNNFKLINLTTSVLESTSLETYFAHLFHNLKYTACLIRQVVKLLEQQNVLMF